MKPQHHSNLPKNQDREILKSGLVINLDGGMFPLNSVIQLYRNVFVEWNM